MSRFLVDFGVCRLDQYVPGDRSAEVLLEPRISYQLLRTSIPPSAAEIARFEDVMWQLRLPSGVFRTTAADRFRDFDIYLNGILSRAFSQRPSLDVHDWAASDASASAAWFHTLRSAFPEARLTASDLSLYLIEARSAGGDAYIFDATGEVLQYIRPPFVIRMGMPEPRRLLANRLLRKWAFERLARMRQNGLPSIAELDFADNDELRRPPYMFCKIPMVHPSAETVRRSNPAFRVLQHSVFEPLTEPADVIRTMNIFNRGYFGEDRLRQGAGSVWRSLKRGGIWVLGRTLGANPPVHHASVLVRTDHGFDLQERHVEKSEVEDLALAPRLDE
jgi:hypothetical protein